MFRVINKMEARKESKSDIGKRIANCADKWLQKKKGREKGDKYFLESYLEDVRILIDEECCVVKGRCYRSMRKTAKPHDLKIIFNVTGQECSILLTLCSCKAGKGKCQHLSALFTHLKAKGEGECSPTSRLQEWHKPRSSNIIPQRWFESEFVKPRVNRTIRANSRKRVKDFLYDPRPASQREVSIEKMRRLGESIANENPTTYASWLQYIYTEDRVDIPWGNPPKGSTLAHQLRGVYPEDVLNTVYSMNDLESVFKFPRDLVLPGALTKKRTTLTKEEDKLLERVMLTTGDAIDIEKNTRNQSESTLWLQERSFRITASKFGDVMTRKAPINEKFLKALLNTSKAQTQAMKYGLNKEPEVVKDYKELSGPQVEVFKCGLLINPKLYWMGASPDGIIYDPNENPSVGIIEIKCIPSMEGKTIEESLELKRDICLSKDKDGNISLKRSHKYYYQVQGLMGISGLQWCKFCVHTKDGANNLFIEKINFDEQVFQNLVLRVYDLYFSHGLSFLTNK